MKKGRNTVLLALFALFVLCQVKGMAQNIPPIADAGSPRYAAQDPVFLDGTGSFDPDDSGPLSYTWRQIAGPSVETTDTDTATPTISGFAQTDSIQECEFELVVSDGELTSQPDTVKVIIVREFGVSKLIHLNPPFDPNKPTWVRFGGLGGCGNIGSDPSWFKNWPEGWGGWGVLDEKVNYIWYEQIRPYNFQACENMGDMLIVYLSSHAPDYKSPIQTDGHSAGGQPAIDIAIYLNETYEDTRYAVNRVTLFDATGYCRSYSTSIARFLASAVDDEQCWIDSYPATLPGSYGQKMDYGFQANVLTVWFDAATGPGGVQYKHEVPLNFYGNSFIDPSMQEFNHGVVAGSFWSVIGPGKNLQLASTPGVETYKFTWYGDASSGYMDFYDEAQYPGRLPEPVTLVGPIDVGDPNGAVLTCEESENAVGYQLLFGPDPYRVMDYNIISDTPVPPNEVITILPFDETWWTVRVRDQYGSTIYADPICIGVSNLSLPIENLTTGKRYGYIQDSIDDSMDGDEIVVREGICRESIDFKGKNLTLRSANPNDPAVVAGTVIEGYSNKSVVTFSGGEDANCVLAGFTITGGNRGIYCSGSSPTITNCIIAGNTNDAGGGGIGIEGGSNPTLANCTIINNSASTAGGGMISQDSSPMLTNCTFSGNSAGYFGSGICFNGGSPMLTNCILWGDTTEEIYIFSGTPVITYSDVQGGWAGEGNIEADPLFADPDNGDYHLKSQAGRWNPDSQSWVIDDVTSPCIDAGDPGTPVGLEPLPNVGIINMGAYGGTDEASKSPEN